MRHRISQLLTEKYHLFLLVATLTSASGCARSPLLKEWDWGVQPDFAEHDARMERQRIAINKRMQLIHKENPEWENTVSDDVLLMDIYDEKGIKRGRAVIR